MYVPISLPPSHPLTLTFTLPPSPSPSPTLTLTHKQVVDPESAPPQVVEEGGKKTKTHLLVYWFGVPAEQSFSFINTKSKRNQVLSWDAGMAKFGKKKDMVLPLKHRAAHVSGEAIPDDVLAVLGGESDDEGDDSDDEEDDDEVFEMEVEGKGGESDGDEYAEGGGAGKKRKRGGAGGGKKGAGKGGSAVKKAKTTTAAKRGRRVDGRPRQLKKLDLYLWTLLNLHKELIDAKDSAAEISVVLDKIANAEVSLVAIVASQLGRHIAALTAHQDATVGDKAQQIKKSWTAMFKKHKNPSDLLKRLESFDMIFAAPVPSKSEDQGTSATSTSTSTSTTSTSTTSAMPAMSGLAGLDELPTNDLPPPPALLTDPNDP